jgi:hypothetical protein
MAVTKYLDRLNPYKKFKRCFMAKRAVHNYPKGGGDLLG